MQINAFIGYDTRQPLAYATTVRSLLLHTKADCPIYPLLLPDMVAKSIYDRPMHSKAGQMYDEISEAGMATEFAISRFFIPYLTEYSPAWTLFCDSDFLFRADIAELFAHADDSKAVMCVKHNYAPPENTKMDGQMQTLYERKNWSSLMLIHNAHPKNRALHPAMLNTLPGRDLHRFCWLDDSEIGELPPEWNWLEGHSDPALDPKAVHFTRGTPDMAGYEDVPYADEWRNVARTINLCKAL